MGKRNPYAGSLTPTAVREQARQDAARLMERIYCRRTDDAYRLIASYMVETITKDD